MYRKRNKFKAEKPFKDLIQFSKKYRIETGKAEVNCGNHRAASCSECPQGNGEPWCNGECEWQTSTCVSKSVNCGNHRAASCSECPQGNGAPWCNGECEWQTSTCVFKGNFSKYISK